MASALLRSTPSALALTVVLFAAVARGQEAKTQTLYARLGGHDAIAAVVDQFAHRLFSDPKLQRFFGGFGDDTKKKFIHHNIDLICAVTGGPCTYLGRSMPETHHGLGITGADFDAVAGHLVATLDANHVPKKEKDELIAIVAGLRPQIVEKP
jgi:hemoglobin